MIAGVSNNGFRWTRFSPCNTPPAYTCPLDKTTVQIAACLKFLNILETSVPTMTWDHWSHDIDDNIQINASNLCSFHLQIRYVPPRSTTMISFTTPDFGCLKYQTQLLSYVSLLYLMIYGHPSHKSMALFHPWTFDLFNLDQRSNDPLLNQRSRSSLGIRTSEISNLKLSSLLTGYLPDWKICWHVPP